MQAGNGLDVQGLDSSTTPSWQGGNRAQETGGEVVAETLTWPLRGARLSPRTIMAKAYYSTVLDHSA